MYGFSDVLQRSNIPLTHDGNVRTGGRGELRQSPSHSELYVVDREYKLDRFSYGLSVEVLGVVVEGSHVAGLLLSDVSLESRWADDTNPR